MTREGSPSLINDVHCKCKLGLVGLGRTKKKKKKTLYFSRFLKALSMKQSMHYVFIFPFTVATELLMIFKRCAQKLNEFKVCYLVANQTMVLTSAWERSTDSEHGGEKNRLSTVVYR